MKDKKLVFTDNTIYFEDDPKELVMMDWEHPLMKKHAKLVCQKGGDILEIGFGMGISAEYIQSHNIDSHTIIEIHPQVIERLKTWAQSHPNVRIIEGDWYTLKMGKTKFNGIFFDTYNDTNFKKLRDFIDIHINPGGVFSYFDPIGVDRFNYKDKFRRDLVVAPSEKNFYYDKDLSFCPWIQY